MHLKSFRHLIRKVYVTQDEELDCDQLLQNLPQYVEMEVVGEQAQQHFPDIKHHLDQCTECYDLYLTVRDVARLEQQRVAPELADLHRS
jgi:predicted anti-sigma-YlaC factor YlaD